MARARRSNTIGNILQRVGRAMSDGGAPRRRTRSRTAPTTRTPRRGRSRTRTPQTSRGLLRRLLG